MAMISGDTKLMGLLGCATSYTLSPAMHNHAIKLMHKDLVYVNFDLPEESVLPFLKVFWNLGGLGLNVTKPYKSLIASTLEDSDLRSVNTLARGPNGWVGYSTDGLGFDRGLGRIGCEAKQFSKLVLLGNGGSALALVEYFFTLKDTRLQSVSIIRRDPSKDCQFEKFVSSFQMEFLDWRPTNLSPVLDHAPGPDTLLVQATSAPSQGERLSDWRAALVNFSGSVVDLVYDSPSDIYFEALHRGLKCQDGLAMLIEQARLSQEIWWGKSAPFDETAKAIKLTGRFHREPEKI